MAEQLSLYMPSWLAYSLAALVHCVLLIHVVAVGALVFIWMERKVAGRIQDRLGPTRVGGKFGWLQTLADGIKLITKEDLMPKGADPLLFKLAPYVSFCASFAAYLALPFADGWVGAADERRRVLHRRRAGPGGLRRDPGRLCLGLEVVAVRRDARGGPGRELRSADGPVRRRAGADLPASMDLVTIGNMQAGWFTNWLIFHDPFTFVMFWVYFTCATASVNRAPFDLAEAESELVAGFHTEYSGLRWSFFFMAEYGSMFAVSGLASILFFGGWNGPIPITHMLGMAYEPGESWHIWRLPGATCWGCSTSSSRRCVGVTVMMWVRWTLPRLRIDQVMTTCLKYCMPLAAICFLGAIVLDVPASRRRRFAQHALRLGAGRPAVHQSDVCRGGEPLADAQRAAGCPAAASQSRASTSGQARWLSRLMRTLAKEDGRGRH